MNEQAKIRKEKKLNQQKEKLKIKTSHRKKNRSSIYNLNQQAS